MSESMLSMLNFLKMAGCNACFPHNVTRHARCDLILSVKITTWHSEIHSQQELDFWYVCREVINLLPARKWAVMFVWTGWPWRSYFPTYILLPYILVLNQDCKLSLIQSGNPVENLFHWVVFWTHKIKSQLEAKAYSLANIKSYNF